MTLRIATEGDIHHCLGLARKLHASSPYAVLPFSITKTGEQLLKCIKEGVVILSDNGILVATILIPHFTTQPIATELLWGSVADDLRTKVREERDLHLAYEYWAQHVAKVKLLQTATWRPGKFLDDRGFIKCETTYVKGL